VPHFTEDMRLTLAEHDSLDQIEIDKENSDLKNSREIEGLTIVLCARAYRKFASSCA